MLDPTGQDQDGGTSQPAEAEREGGPNERYEKNPLRYLFLAALLFWVGVFFLLRNRHIIPETGRGWATLVWGAAALAYLEIFIRLLWARFRDSIPWILVWAVVWTGVGCALWFGAF